MADRHPYTPASGHLVQAVNQLRKSFPPKVAADTLKKLGIAPSNESYILNILRFLELIDQEGNKTDQASKVFLLHDNATFADEFARLVINAYQDLFALQGENAWDLATDALITFFRSSDSTTALVGKLQASTFQILAGFAGHGSVPEPKTSPSKPTAEATKRRGTKSRAKTTPAEEPSLSPPITDSDSARRIGDFGLTVRIEINLPADGDQETYDRIFRSLRENLLNE